jgi:predicted DNA-binding transcriptional regulator YafY
VLEKPWHPRQKLIRRKGGEVELILQATGLYEVFRWTLGWGRHVKVLAPAELAQMVRDEVKAMSGRKR